MKDSRNILVTGAAGFIGFHLVKRLLDQGDSVYGIDNINSYYDVGLKYGRLAACGISRQEADSGKEVQSSLYPACRFRKMALEDRSGIEGCIRDGRFDILVHLAAQAGVRYSLENPHAYVESNISGFLNILEGCRHSEIGHLVYASSSSVYGLNEAMPFSTSHNVDHPVSLYAASKKANELMAHAYSHLYRIPGTGLRFFTVYGPWGRPDMAPILFAEAMTSGKPIKVFNHGKMRRDFTYIDDIVDGIIAVMDRPPRGNPLWNAESPDPATSPAPYRMYNLGNSQPVELMDFIHALEESLGVKAIIDYQPMQPGDVPATWADTSDLEKETGYKPSTPIATGVEAFARWFLDYKSR